MWCFSSHASQHFTFLVIRRFKQRYVIDRDHARSACAVTTAVTDGCQMRICCFENTLLSIDDTIHRFLVLATSFADDSHTYHASSFLLPVRKRSVLDGPSVALRSFDTTDHPARHAEIGVDDAFRRFRTPEQARFDAELAFFRDFITKNAWLRVEKMARVRSFTTSEAISHASPSVFYVTFDVASVRGFEHNKFKFQVLHVTFR